VGTSFVLLVGGSEAFPIRRASIYYNFVCDLYYSDVYNATGGFCSWDANGNGKFGEFMVDGVDIHPDVHLGRLPCVNESQVEIWWLSTLESRKVIHRYKTVNPLLSATNSGMEWPVSIERFYPMFQYEKPLFYRISKSKGNMFPFNI
jgi:hypothetical protein